jgi:hypothetical protein
MRPCLVAAVAALTTVAVGRAADGDEDVELIPDAVLDGPPQPAASDRAAAPQPTLVGRFFLEDAVTLSSWSGGIPVPYPAPLVSWQNRLSFDLSLRWKPSKALVLNLSDRLSIFAEEGSGVLASGTVRNAFREGYASWQPSADMYLELGRINARKGAALGFNPTDFFKT